MSAENVEVVRRWLAAMGASPEQAVRAVRELWDADADHYPVRKFPEARPSHGVQELSQFIAQFWEAFSVVEWAIRDLIPVGDDRVLAWLNLRSEGRGSGARVQGDIYHCYWIRHGRLFRGEDHMTLRGALHALGLEGETLEAAGLAPATERRPSS